MLCHCGVPHYAVSLRGTSLRVDELQRHLREAFDVDKTKQKKVDWCDNDRHWVLLIVRCVLSVSVMPEMAREKHVCDNRHVLSQQMRATAQQMQPTAQQMHSAGVVNCVC